MNVQAYREARVALDPGGGGRDVVGELVPLSQLERICEFPTQSRMEVLTKSVFCVVITAFLAPLLYPWLPLPAVLADFHVFAGSMLCINALNLLVFCKFWLWARRQIAKEVDETISASMSKWDVVRSLELACFFGPLLAATIADLLAWGAASPHAWIVTVAVVSNCSMLMARLVQFAIEQLFVYAKSVS